jgi:hypothetical protein
MSQYRGHPFKTFISKHLEVAEQCEGLLLYIFTAIGDGNVDEAVRLITKFKVQTHRPFLEDAILYGKLEMVKAIVELGCPVEKSDVLLAIRRGTDLDAALYIVDTYLSKRTSHDRRELFKTIRMPLYTIADRIVHTGSARLLQELIARGLHVEDFPGDFVKITHCVNLDVMGVDLLRVYLRNGGCIDGFMTRENFGDTMLRTDVIDVMIENGACPSSYLFTLCKHRINNTTSFAAIRRLIQKGAAPSDRCIYGLAITTQIEHLKRILPAMTLGPDDRPMLTAALDHLIYITRRDHLYVDDETALLISFSGIEEIFPTVGIGSCWSVETGSTLWSILVTAKLLVLYGAEIPRENNPLRDLLVAFRQKVEFSLIFEKLNKMSHVYKAPRDLAYTIRQFV